MLTLFVILFQFKYHFINCLIFSATADQLGNLTVTFDQPGAGQGGRYACQALGVDDTGRPAVLTAATDVGVAKPDPDQGGGGGGARA